ncbi:MAG: hypothetical protein Q8O55_01055 [Dehalococcoidales bacterium]|nr:hypothetical protein [Dehalococcoidales bacterium]
MGIVTTITVLATLAFAGWLVFRAIKARQVKAHHITFGIAVIAGIFTYGFFLTMDIPQLVKIFVSIFVGIILIFLASYIQRRYYQSRA